ncbi:hypothetical protein CEXT_535061 [Caerostris extrusa]|uniref:Uncharacterized protein n=1 Tax=Caerostris extrusa TaxID=172846 RepID=A0AAV4QR28_CAEEX|nr:hypothetical protein CEXT_535061 [Caerostris extrusa]
MQHTLKTKEKVLDFFLYHPYAKKKKPKLPAGVTGNNARKIARATIDLRDHLTHVMEHPLNPVLFLIFFLSLPLRPPSLSPGRALVVPYASP